MPTQQEIDRQVALAEAQTRKLYRGYKIRSWLGIPTKGINTENSLLINAIKAKNKVDGRNFVVINNIDRTETDYLLKFHKIALQIGEDNYITVFFNTRLGFGDYVIGNNILKKLDTQTQETLHAAFKKRIARQEYFRALEQFIKAINHKLG